MYQAGEVKFGRKVDSRADHYDEGDWFYLPHSCDYWVIGNREQAELLIQDLKKLLEAGK